MKQIYLIVYLESLGCEEVRKSASGYYVMRNLRTGVISGVPVPSNGDVLKEETICNICHTLGVDPPPATQEEINQIMVNLKSEVENRINGGDF